MKKINLRGDNAPKMKNLFSFNPGLEFSLSIFFIENKVIDSNKSIFF